MFSVKKMSEQDFEFAVKLTDTEDWNFVEDDFKFMTELEPEGCFVLFDDSERIGIVTSISFGRIGWLGNLIVKEDYRKRGAGALLAKRVIKYLSSRNVETVGLYAYTDTIPFYKKLGFKKDSEFMVLEGKASPSSIETNPQEAKKEDFQKIIDYDCYCFGASRKKLLEAIFRDGNNLCYLFTQDRQPLGYIMAKVYEGFAEIGPLTCQQGRSDVAIDLLKAALNRMEGFEVSLCVPKKEFVMLDFLLKLGFNERFRVVRMFFNSFNAKDCIYMAESLERG